MSLDGLFSEKDVAGLGVEAFRSVINRLLKVEASIYAVPLPDLNVTLRENDPDGGVDARVKWPSTANQEVLMAGENVVQYKTGKVDKRVIKKEFLKRGVQDCLKSGGYYLLLISQDCDSLKIARLREDLGALCESAGFARTQSQSPLCEPHRAVDLPPPKCDCYDGVG
jgi:hypothetical protein